MIAKEWRDYPDECAECAACLYVPAGMEMKMNVEEFIDDEHEMLD